MTDDIIVHGQNQGEHDELFYRVLQRLKEAGLTPYSDKCKFSQKTVKFLGHVVNRTGIQPNLDKVSAIQKFGTPQNTWDIRRFLGMVNQLSKFSPNLAEETHPLRDLLVKDKAWTLDHPQQRTFDRIKQMLTKAHVLAHINLNQETILSVDASSFGLGAVLLQRQQSGDLQPVAYISCYQTPMEQRYAQIEKEALTFTWTCERLSDYLLGLTFHIQTNHKPLVPLFFSKHLKELTVSVQRFRLRMMRFDLTISHVPGKHLAIGCSLSCANNKPGLF